MEKFDIKIVITRKKYIKWSFRQSFRLSKVLMYDFHYDQIKNKYNGKAELFFIDAGSLMYEIRNICEDFYKSK